MIKKSLVSFCLLLSIASFAQQGTSSPYSFYGIGETRFKGTLESRSMAGLSMEADSIHINLQNPAGYSSLKLTTFTMGGTSSSTKLKTTTESATAQRTTLDYFAVAFPVGKFGFGLGLIPYSSVGYKIQSLATTPGENDKRFEGSGGLNKAFLGFGFKIMKGLDFGADATYNYGSIETSNIEFLPEIIIGSREFNSVLLSGVNFNLGLMYQRKLNKKLNFYSAINFSPQNNLTSNNTRTIGTVRFISDFEVVSVDQFDDEVIKKTLKIPSKLTFGAGIGESKKWFVGTEFKIQDVGDLGNTYNSLDNVSYEKYYKYSLGGYYVPSYNSYSNYLKRMTYRGGLKFEQTGLVVNSQSINDRALTFGIGLPMIGSFSNINFGLEFGKKGTTSNNLVQEDYANLSVSFSLNDKWFVQRKFF